MFEKWIPNLTDLQTCVLVEIVIYSLMCRTSLILLDVSYPSTGRMLQASRTQG